jgi:glutamate/tyrosine decarboxylase-like PLP-dependent enzyme
VDPLAEILALRERYGFRVHVDAAYGGYFALADGLAPAAARAFAVLGAADSLAIDPHKHGLQPYGCGCVLFRDPGVGRHYRHDSPYTYFTEGALHLGEISLECSRAGAAAVALWTTQRALPLTRGGEFAAGLDDCLAAARAGFAFCDDHPHLVPLLAPELDILNIAVRAPTAAHSSALAQRVFDAAAARDLHLALARIPRHIAEGAGAVDTWDLAETLTCLRLCTMKPAHRHWMDEICARLADAVAEVLARRQPRDA